MGVRTIGEVLRLPRDGFAQRFAQTAFRRIDAQPVVSHCQSNVATAQLNQNDFRTS